MIYLDANHLSQRLQKVADLVEEGARLADIGSDHAYLPAKLILKQRINFAVAGEVAKGPFENEQAEIKQLGLENKIIARLGDGLAAIKAADQIDTITIAGMGGSLIASILDHGQEKLGSVKRLILQPNVGENRVRQWLAAHRWQILQEELVAEDGHIYEIIMAEPSVCPVAYNQRELLFGPLLIEQGGPVFQEKWLAEQKRLEKVLQNIQQADQVPTQHLAELRNKMSLIKEVLKYD